MSHGNYDPRFSPDPFQPHSASVSPQSGAPFGPSRPQKNSKTLLIVLGSLLGSMALFVMLCCGGLYYVTRMPTPSSAAKQPFDLAAVPIPDFPERGLPKEFVPGVNLHTVQINGQTGGHYSPAGHGGTIFVYLPAGNHSPKSLPCVLITGAGTNLMEGVEFGEIELEEDAAEHLPYVKAGMAVVVYDMDGSYFEDEDGIELDTQMFHDFEAACAGMVNARNAFEFTLQRFPEVNPQQVYTAGHSSAGTAALLFAAHEPRVAGVVAYAPCADVEHFHPAFAVRGLAARYPGLIDFLCQSSPTTHHQRINCPVLLFSSEDDSVVDIADTRKFADLLRQHNTNVTLRTTPTGDHYDAMIDQGIPAAIEWLKQQQAGN